MFKSVKYAGFEGRPELRAAAERLTPVLADEINTWRDRVAVTWSPHPDATRGVLDLTLALALPNGVSGARTGTVTAEDFERDPWLASRCRGVWSDLLGALLDQQHRRVEEFLSELVEA